MQDKTAVLGNTPGVEEDERYIEKAYRTLSEDNRKKLEVYAAALRRSSHMKGLIETVPLYIGPSALPMGFCFNSEQRTGSAFSKPRSYK